MYNANFAMHWHSDLEILYCSKGTFKLLSEENEFTVNAGDVVFVGSCQPHALSAEEDVEGCYISIGFLFLGEEFGEIRNLNFVDPVLRGSKEVEEEIDAIVKLHESEKTLAVNLEIRGRVYRLIAHILNGMSKTESIAKRQQDRLFAVSKIQKALDFVAMHYSENITVEQAAEVSGYEKSSFCRSFKNATNATFHNYLNAYRVKKAKILLTESDDSISAVSYKVGFTQHKNFCRLFKEINGLSPSEYRKKYR
jgi:AraC-like DNA-binding protein